MNVTELHPEKNVDLISTKISFLGVIVYRDIVIFMRDENIIAAKVCLVIIITRLTLIYMDI